MMCLIGSTLPQMGKACNERVIKNGTEGQGEGDFLLIPSSSIPYYLPPSSIGVVRNHPERSGILADLFRSIRLGIIEGLLLIILDDRLIVIEVEEDVLR